MKYSLVFLSLFVLFACTNNGQTTSIHSEQNERDLLLAEINQMEADHRSSEVLEVDSMKGVGMIEKYQSFVTNFPEDGMVPELLFKCGELSSGIRDYWAATKYFNDLHLKYPDHPLAEQALFLQGVCFLDLGQSAYAVQTFEDLRQRFPDGSYSEMAGDMIEMAIMGEEEYYESKFEKE